MEDFDLLRASTGNLADVLFPGEPAAATVPDLVRRIGDGADVVDRLRDLAARSGAEVALALMLSWYQDATLEQLKGGFRVGAELPIIRQQHPDLRETAILVGSWADVEDLDSISSPQPEREAPPESSSQAPTRIANEALVRDRTPGKVPLV